MTPHCLLHFELYLGPLLCSKLMAEPPLLTQAQRWAQQERKLDQYEKVGYLNKTGSFISSA